MNVDKPWRDDFTLSVQDMRSRAIERADLHNASVFDSDITNS